MYNDLRNYKQFAEDSHYGPKRENDPVSLDKVEWHKCIEYFVQAKNKISHLSPETMCFNIR